MGFGNLGRLRRLCLRWQRWWQGLRIGLRHMWLWLGASNMLAQFIEFPPQGLHFSQDLIRTRLSGPPLRVRLLLIFQTLNQRLQLGGRIWQPGLHQVLDGFSHVAHSRFSVWLPTLWLPTLWLSTLWLPTFWLPTFWAGTFCMVFRLRLFVSLRGLLALVALLGFHLGALTRDDGFDLASDQFGQLLISGLGRFTGFAFGLIRHFFPAGTEFLVGPLVQCPQRRFRSGLAIFGKYQITTREGGQSEER